jgi:putative acetyltransferase
MELNLKSNLRNWNTGKGFSSISISEYKSNYLTDLIKLFYETVHCVNAEDYTKDQLDTWAPEKIDTEKWESRIKNNYVIVATDRNKVIEFGELSPEGCIDMLYVYKDYLRQKVGYKLLKCLIQKAKKLGLTEVFAEASIIAKPFFEKRGFELMEKQVKTFNGADFVNFKMKKRI